ncbi:MAG: hypothetical protein PHC61_07705 [Chitinivibrionales bacterium]|nr:hypothetical protein [Chitinivibrionales bacterium]
MPFPVRVFCVFLLMGICVGLVSAGPLFTFNDGKSNLEITQTYQVWGAYTRSIDDIPVTDSRADLFLKQGRAGFKGQIIPSLTYSTIFAFDNLGKDQFTGSLGSAQATTNSTFLLYDFYLTYALDTSFANLTFGYFRPQSGHENIAPDAGVNSLDKALTSLYLRQFLTGRTSGRETGMNLGGFCQYTFLSAAYNVGVFDPNQQAIAGTDGGARKWAPLTVGRLALSAGQPDMPGYRLSPEINFFGSRAGVTLGAHYAYQNATDETWDTSAVKYNAVSKAYSGAVKYVGGFKSNSSYGVDFVANFKGLNLDGEYDFMARDLNGASFHHDSITVAAVDYRDKAYHLRAGYDFPILKGQFLEPALMYTKFIGDSKSAVYPNGLDQIIDAGVNWYIKKNSLKIALHYLHQTGQAISNYEPAAPTATKETVRGDMAAINFQIQI